MKGKNEATEKTTELPNENYMEKVTFDNNASSTKKVHHFLQKNIPREYNAPTVSRLTGIRKDTVRVILHRLYCQNKIKRPHRGFYRGKIDETSLSSLGNPELRFHGIKIEAKLLKAMDGIDANNAVMAALGFESKTNGRFCRVLWYEGRKITITLHCKGLVEIWVRSSDNPLNFEELRALLNFLNGFLEPLGPLANRVLRQVGINKDYRSLRLDGVTSIPLNDFMNSVARIYQKEKDIVRVERHVDTKIELDEAICILSRVSEPSIDISGRLSGIETKLEQLLNSAHQLLSSTDNDEGDEI